MITFTHVAIGTTIFLLLYLAGMIAYDKRKQKGASSGKEEEEFDVSFMGEEEKAVGVQESGDGFTLDKPTEKREEKQEDIYQNNKENMKDDMTSQSHGKLSAIKQKIGKVEDDMEAIEPIGSATMSKELFRDLLLNAHERGSLFIRKVS
ncbi:hypothetical protein [Bacteroides timonensis]|uniref:hypothetical protein n=1 Tax=Bacteroides timonensis TaxID=1470345 RepID=UPI0004AD0A5A|nr:hypothetical protein [Bacteroides timonensis]